MRVLFQSYYDFGRMYGGGPSVVYSLAEELQRLGVEITFHDYWKHDPKDFDLIHYFSCSGAANWLTHRDSDPPLLVTPINWFQFPTRRKIEENTKLILRMLVHRTTNRRLLAYPFEFPQHFFPNSEGEAMHLSKAFHVPRSKMTIIPHGASNKFRDGDALLFENTHRIKDFVLCVGRFEFPRKNQLTLVQALKSEPIPLVFIGGPDLGHEAYYERCRSEAGPNTHFLPPVSRDDPMLVSAYHACKVVVMPALLESPGLTGLEGALGGANVATTEHGSTREYYGADAWYFDPRNNDSIRKAVLRAFEAPRTESLKHRVAEKFTWDKIALVQKRAYEKLSRTATGR